MRKLSLDRVLLTARVLGLGKEELFGYDGYKHIKGAKIHVLVSREALP